MDPAHRLLMLIYIWLEDVNKSDVDQVRKDIKDYLVSVSENIIPPSTQGN